MKRIVAILLILSMLALASCGRDSEIVPDATDTAETTVLDDSTALPDETTGDTDLREPDESTLIPLPGAYIEVVEDYKQIVEYRLSDRFTDRWSDDILEIIGKYSHSDIQGDFGYMIIDMPDYINEASTDSYGYVLYDLNGDGIDELIWVSTDFSFIYAIFTVDNGQALLLDAFWPRYKCVITENGEIHTSGSGSAWITHHIIRTLDKNSSNLTVVNYFGSDTDYERNEYYFEMNGEEKKIITEARFEELLYEYPFENGESWKKSFVYPLPKDYYLTEMSEENIVSIIVPDVGFDGVISNRVTSYLTEHFFECQLEKTDSVSKDFLERFDNREYAEYCVELEGTVTRSDEEIISIKFEGLVNYMTAAHPNHVLFSVNVDKATGERVLFADKYNITEDLYDVFLRYAQAEIDSVAGEGTVSVEEQLCTKDSFIDGISDETTVCVYYSSESIVISYEVPFAVGGHREVEIPLSELSQFAK